MDVTSPILSRSHDLDDKDGNHALDMSLYSRREIVTFTLHVAFVRFSLLSFIVYVPWRKELVVRLLGVNLDTRIGTPNYAEVGGGWHEFFCSLLPLNFDYSTPTRSKRTSISTQPRIDA